MVLISLRNKSSEERGPVFTIKVQIINILVVKDDPSLAAAGGGGVVIATIFGQGCILREIRDFDAITISA